MEFGACNTARILFIVRTISSALTTAAIAAQHDEASDEQTKEHHIIVFGEGRRL